MTPTIRLSRCSLSATEEEAVLRVLRGGYLGMGAETRQFEEELTAYLGGGVGVACVSTGTAALQLALQACGIGPGDEVLVPTLTLRQVSNPSPPPEPRRWRC